jgi:hypothetical protein
MLVVKWRAFLRIFCHAGKLDFAISVSKVDRALRARCSLCLKAFGDYFGIEQGTARSTLMPCRAALPCRKR